MEGVALHPRARFLHQVREGRQRHKLAGGEEVGKRHQAVVRRLEVTRVHGQCNIGLPLRLGLERCRFVLRRRREIDPAAIALGHDCHQPRVHAPGLALSPDVVVRDRRARHHALKGRALAR